jgi:hypothetical protein
MHMVFFLLLCSTTKRNAVSVFLRRESPHASPDGYSLDFFSEAAQRMPFVLLSQLCIRNTVHVFSKNHEKVLKQKLKSRSLTVPQAQPLLSNGAADVSAMNFNSFEYPLHKVKTEGNDNCFENRCAPCGTHPQHPRRYASVSGDHLTRPAPRSPRPA